MSRHRLSAPLFRRKVSALTVLALALATTSALADDAAVAVGAATEATPLADSGTSWRSEMRRLLAPEGSGYLPTSAAERRAISREERHRLREDIRANRDIYELRERPGRNRR